MLARNHPKKPSKTQKNSTSEKPAQQRNQAAPRVLAPIVEAGKSASLYKNIEKDAAVAVHRAGHPLTDELIRARRITCGNDTIIVTVTASTGTKLLTYKRRAPKTEFETISDPEVAMINGYSDMKVNPSFWAKTEDLNKEQQRVLTNMERASN